jgi:hypothetical protein
MENPAKALGDVGLVGKNPNVGDEGIPYLDDMPIKGGVFMVWSWCWW